MSVQRLRFTLRVARSEAELRAACRVRSASYGHHLPNLRNPFSEPDELDWSADTAVFVACDKDTGAAVGTVRLATNGRQPLQIEHSTVLPEPLSDHVLAEVTRLAVLPGHDDPRVKLALMKATYLYCMARQVQWMVIGARSEGLIRQYRRLGFTDLLADGTMVPLAHAGNLPHRILGFDVTSAERNWHAAQHPFYEFMVRTYHPDIELFSETIPRSAPVRLALAA
jgi:ribosomal protein S18 acetylase RimI-like enzyme